MTEATYSFEKAYTGIEDLRPESKKGIYVHEGHSDISSKGAVLESEGFTRCSALIIQKDDSKDAFMAHIDDWDMNNGQYDMMRSLPYGKYKAVFVKGSVSRVGSDVIVNPKLTDFMRLFSFGGRRELTILPDFYVESGPSHWAVSYDPIERKVKTIVRKGLLVSEYSLPT